MNGQKETFQIFTFVMQAEYIATNQFLTDRFSKAQTVPGSQKLYAFIPSSETKIIVKPCSFTETSIEHTITCV